MKNELIIPINEIVRQDDVKNNVLHVGVKGLDTKKAEELGLFQRISTLICAMHSLYLVGHKLYGSIDYLFSLAHIKKHEIKKACVDFEKAYENWFKFWRGYQTLDGVQEMNRESEDLYRQFMRWACIPTQWKFGERQDAIPETEPLIEIESDDKVWRLYRDVAERERLEDTEQEWGVLLADREDGRRVMRCIERGMDKASAQMSAKRMSANDPENVYTASLLETIVEKRIDIIPYKAYKGGEIAGTIKSVIKK